MRIAAITVEEGADAPAGRYIHERSVVEILNLLGHAEISSELMMALERATLESEKHDEV